jgi:hypothetical protein
MYGNILPPSFTNKNIPTNNEHTRLRSSYGLYKDYVQNRLPLNTSSNLHESLHFQNNFLCPNSIRSSIVKPLSELGIQNLGPLVLNLDRLS